MIGIRWTFQKRIWGTFIVLSLLSTASKGQVPKLSVSSNQVEIGLNFTVICEVEIISDILFFVNGAKKGDCPNPAFGDPCEPKVIEQNITLGETSWTLTAAIEYEGSWKCNRQGIESSVVDVSMYECPKSVTSQSGIDTSLSLNETATVSITVKIGCIYPTNNPEILLRFISSHSSVVPYITMNCIATAGFCSAGSVFECNQTISRGMEITNGPFDSGINYTLHVDSIVAPSVSTCGRLAVFEPHSLVFETQGESRTDDKSCNARLIFLLFFALTLLCVTTTFLLVIWFNIRFPNAGKVVLIITGVVVDVLWEILLLWGIEYCKDFKLFKSDSNCGVFMIGVVCHVFAVGIEIVKVVVQYRYIEKLGARIFVCCRPDGKIREVCKNDVEKHPSHTLLPAKGDDRKCPSADSQSETVAKPEDIMLFIHFTVPLGYTVNKWVTEENASVENNPKYVSNDRGTLLIKSATEKDNGIYQGILTSDGNEQQRVNAVLHVTGQRSANLIINPLIWRQVKTKKLKKIGDLKEIRHKVSRNDIKSIPLKNEEESQVRILSIRWEHNGKITQNLSKYKDGDDSVPPLTVTKHQPIDEYHCTVDFTNKKSHVYIFIVKFTGVRSGNTPQSTALQKNKVDTVDDVVGVPTILSTRREEITSSLPPLRHTATTAQDRQTSDRLPVDENNLHPVTARSSQSTGAEDNL